MLYIHLKVRTHYSLGASTIEAKELAAKAVELNMPAIGVADFDNLYGCLEFSKTVLGVGVQPIIGCTLSLADIPQNPNKIALPAKNLLTLYAKNETGYNNLLKIVSYAYLKAASNEAPHTTIQRISEYNEGLLCLSGSVDTEIFKRITENRIDEATASLRHLKDIFADRFYLEITRHNTPDELAVEEHLLNLAYDTNTPIVAVNDVRFLNSSMFEATDALVCISDGTFIADEKRFHLSREYRLKSQKEMLELFRDIPEAINNTCIIAERCAIKSPSRAPILPSYEGSEGRSETEEFIYQSQQGLKFRLETEVLPTCISEEEKKAKIKLYNDRLDFEIAVITRMKFAGYFLIVSDFIRYAKEQNIPVGPGRGSGAGSIVAWSMLITELDPIRFGLLFERFLNPDRVSMPDFDIDFCQDRREEVIHYVQEKYGIERVAQIITFGKLQARAVLRDVGRVMQLPYGQVDRVCKLIPANPANPVDLPQALEIEPLIKQAMSEDPYVDQMVKLGLQLEGVNRNSSTHAAGLVIGDRPLEQLVPMYRDPKSEMPVIQFNMKYAEEAGLVKFDFLGLKTLTVIQKAVDLANERKSIGQKLDIKHIPLNDKATFEMLGRGDSVGVFQIESSGMRDTLKRMRPDTIEDIIALISLYRPGPMENIPTYIACKHGLQQPDYPHIATEETLKETFGVIIYQEQVMQIAQVLAGYTLAEADLLRRAMGKKIKAEMEAQREIFATKAAETGIVAKKKAAEIFDLIAKFASYGFNKSHAAAYGLISYQTGYLKANYPVEFMVANMNYEINDTDKLATFIIDSRRMGITVLPPDVNKSESLFSIEELEGRLAIRYGLSAIRNVSGKATEELVRIRKEGGEYTSLSNFAARLGKTLNQRMMEFLIKAGALECLETNRRSLHESLDIILGFASSAHETRNDTQVSLFGDILSEESSSLDSHNRVTLRSAADYSDSTKLTQEFDAIGFYLTRHPLDEYSEALGIAGYRDFATFSTKLTEAFGEVRGAGVILQSKFKTSKKGRFAFADISDLSGSFEVSIYDEFIIDRQRDILNAGTTIAFEADAKRDEGGIRVIIKKIYPIQDAMKRIIMPPRKFSIKNTHELKAAINEASHITNRKLTFEITTAKGHIVIIDVPERKKIAMAA